MENVSRKLVKEIKGKKVKKHQEKVPTKRPWVLKIKCFSMDIEKYKRTKTRRGKRNKEKKKQRGESSKKKQSGELEKLGRKCSLKSPLGGVSKRVRAARPHRYEGQRGDVTQLR